MGPPPKSGASAPRRCLLCRHDALSPAAQHKANVKLKRCATSLCTIFGLSDTHPFKIIYERAQYCEPCLKEVQEADVTLGKLELMRQNLLRFQNRVYSKLGDNYFQIENRDALKASYVDFEKGGEAMKGKKFSYDDIVKVIYEKLDKDCLKWERFSSEAATGYTNLGLSSKVEMATQTENFVVPSAQASSSTSSFPGITSLVNNSDIPEVIVPDDNDDVIWDEAGGDDGGASDFDDATSSSIGQDPLNTTTSTIVEIDYGPEAKGLPFTKAPINFENKIFCTFDPEKCKRFFYDDYNLNVHIKSFHEGNPLPHECTVCKKGFVDEGRLKHHFLRIHVTSDACMCEHCGKGFATPSVLREHVRKKHINGKDASYNCSFCTAPFISEIDQKEHENLHRSKTVPFSCVFCPEEFPNSIMLRAHYFKVHVETKFTCHVCGKSLASENSLKIHLKMHTGEFQCDMCGFSGSSMNSLKQHMLTHSSEKPHTCELCGHAFKYIKNLNSHMRIHTGEKPYCCSICGMQFRELSYLRRHEESHSTGTNYQCPDCGAGFKVKENMTKHRRIHKEGYVPKKKVYKPRTEQQKLQRRMKRQMKTQKFSDALPRSLVETKKRTTTSPTKAITAREGDKTSPNIKTKQKRGVKRKRPGPASKTRKGSKQKSTTKKRRQEPKEEVEDYDSDVEEEEIGDDILVAEKEEVIEELTYTIDDEVSNAVASIQETSAVGEDVYSNTVVYSNHFQPQTLIPTTTTATTFIPVTVMSTQGTVKSASQLVVRTRTQLQQHQYQFL